MKTVLLVIESEVFGLQVKKELQKDHTVLLCHSARDAAILMERRPDAMVLQLELPEMDGLMFLENLACRPPVILTIAANYTPYSTQRLVDYGVGYFVRTPCTLRAVADRLRDMLRDREPHNNDTQTISSAHLQILGISAHSEGGKQLRVGIPLFAQDPRQKLKYQLYPAIAEICDTTDNGVERMIRRTIEDAWKVRNQDIWQEYFPKLKRYPSNKVFISTLAEKLY